MKVLVTGNAGFIGFHVAMRLVARGDAVVGIDVVNDYYDPALKRARLDVLATAAAETGAEYRFVRGDLAEPDAVAALFAADRFDRVIHLAAQAGVRHSLEDPGAYIRSNIVAFANLIEACRRAEVPHLVYASTSSVYGANTRLPWSEHDDASHPLQLYAATKRANELMAHAYSHLYRLPTTGLRLFTVYGPWGRPDMALFRFTRAILAGTPIEVFNNGHHSRDFTYIDDIVTGLILASDRIASADPAWNGDAPDPATSNAPYRLINIGNGRPVSLIDYIAALEAALGRKANLDFRPLQPGDLADTSADTSVLERETGYRPRVSVAEGVDHFVRWYRQFYGV